MAQFASRDLMVSVLPESGADVWEMMSSCDGCTNDTNGGCHQDVPKPKPKPEGVDLELAALQEQLRASRN